MNDYDYDNEFYDTDNFEGEVSHKEFDEHVYNDASVKEFAQSDNIKVSDKIKKYSNSFSMARIKSKSSSSKELNTSLNGPEGLDNLSIYTVTWNMGGKSATKNEMELLLPKDKFYHMYAIGSEESMRSILKSFFIADKSEWEKMAQEHLGSDYILIKSENMYAIHLMVFIHKSIVHHISHIGGNGVKTGFYNFGGNKGAVSVWLMYKNVSLLFINCHLAAGHANSSKRNQDLQRIFTSIDIANFKDLIDKYNLLLANPPYQKHTTKYKMNKISKSFTNLKEDYITKHSKNINPPIEYKIDCNSTNISDKFNLTFLMGDLNYRIDSDNFYISECLKMKNLKDLLIYDQLRKEMHGGYLILQNFKEGEIKFIPSYKFFPGTNIYEVGDSKMPGWTDRILYKVQNLSDCHIHLDLRLIDYFSINEVYLSDHKPVGAVFELIL